VGGGHSISEQSNIAPQLGHKTLQWRSYIFLLQRGQFMGLRSFMIKKAFVLID